MKWLDALRPRPVDWTRGAGRPPAARPQSIDIVIPVYGAAAELELCLDSITECRAGFSPTTLILVVDGPQPESVERVITRFAQTARVLRSETRRGFAAAVNRGMSESSGDVILLNSDTIVTERWIEKLIDAAYTNGDIGTVTPLSNHATICSVPRAPDENLIPSGFDVASFARLVERVSARSYPRIPTAVGFCMCIRRALLDDIGLFDAERFAGGYGEENAFSMRALARGWLHVADDATYIYHAGARSFAQERRARQRHAARQLAKAHPRYNPTIAAFLRQDPLAPVRARIVDVVAPRRGGLRIVHIVHGWPPFQQAGAELYASWLVARQREHHDVAVYARSADPAHGEREAVELIDRGARVRLITNHFTARDPLRRNAIRDRTLDRDFERFLRSEKPDIVHIHHLAGHAFSLAAVPRRLGIPIVMQIQDWWFVCARVNRLHRGGARCSGPDVAKCAACADLTRVAPMPLTNRAVHALRRRAARRALAAADAFVSGSDAIRGDYAGVVPPQTPFHVIPYGVAIEPRRTPREVGRPIHFGYVGSIGPHKGVHVAVEAMRGIAPSDAALHVWGDASAAPAYVRAMNAGANVIFEGSFAEAEKGRVFASIDVLIVPSIGLESFGLAPREAMACGVPVIASAGGALSEMFAAGACGDFFPAGDAAALRALMQRVIDDPDLIERWKRQLPRPKDDATHAEEIERVYRAVLAGRGR